ncbi:hypothetical protein BKA62DRAFT_773122 [Auriculariales sp. MPI-PUGE-AT-0066]|nr:hypothetical protein BKA62DRAFT_773122 [Auriculariales sp. MPI-PUGE-AT-0066]
MPSVSTTLDDVSPLIQYTGDWRAGSKTPGPLFDPYFDRYSDGGTFSLTKVNGASATISFYGTRISVYGAKRPNHGTFTTELDGQPVLYGTGHGDPEEFRQAIYTSPILTNNQHTLVITDASGSTDPEQSYFDIDYAIIESNIDGGNKVSVEDTESAWQFTPANAWNTVPQQLASFSQGSGHSTSTPQSAATLFFTGAAIDIYGLVCPTCGSYWVSVDGADAVSYTGYNAAWTKAGSLLFSARGLDEGAHNVTLTNLATNNGNTLALDYAVVHGESPAGGKPTTAVTTGNGNADTAQQNNAAEGSKTPTGAIVGGVVGGLLIVIIGLCLLIFLMRRRRKQQADDASTAPPMSIAQPWQAPGGPHSDAPYSASVYSRPSPGAAGVGWGAGGAFAASPQANAAYYAMQQQQQQHQYHAGMYGGAPSAYGGGMPGYGGGMSDYGGDGMMYGGGVPQGAPSQVSHSHSHSGGLAYLGGSGGARSDASGPSLHPMSVSEFSHETPPDYNAATLNGTVVPPMPVRRKN